ncbi:MAG TPA: tetratricopeptide repeat protein [Candidatus Omnitrophota bacterium]|nr:tetratricopeptide repeat protein [Candidatus Omnitrophota bacterium]
MPALPYSSRTRELFLLLIILIATFFCFYPALNNDFVNWDDNEYVLENEAIRSLSPQHVKKIFTTNLTGKYHPLTMLSYALEYRFFGLNPKAYHATNMALHILNTLLVFVFVRILLANAEIALMAALLFGVHPLQVEPVAWISSRKDVLFMFFYLLGLMSYLQSLSKTPAARYAKPLTYVCFILSLLSKATAVTFGLVLIAIDYYREKGFRRSSVIEKWPFFLIAFLHGIFTLRIIGQVEAFPNTAMYPFWERVLYSALAFVMYIIKVVIPYPLTCYYAPTITWTIVILSVLLIVLGAVLIAVTFRRSALVKFCFLFYAFTIWPVLHLFQMNDSIIYERFMYLPSLGFFILIAYALQRGMQKNIYWLKGLIIFIFIIWLGALVRLSHQQTRIWQNSGCLWSNVIRFFPNAYLAYNNMGVYLEEQHRFDEAMVYFMKMIEVQPDLADGYFKLANILALKFDRTGSIRYYSKAIEHNPQHFEAYNNRANQYLMSGMYDLALKDYTKALESNDSYANAYVNRGMCYYAMKNYPKALEDFKKVLSLEPRNQSAQDKINEIINEQLR